MVYTKRVYYGMSIVRGMFLGPILEPFPLSPLRRMLKIVSWLWNVLSETNGMYSQFAARKWTIQYAQPKIDFD